jgi:hypothetical protein
MTALALALALTADPAAGWEPLFNGKDLAGWTPKIKGHPLGANHNDTFRVADGCIQVRYDKYQKFDETFGHLFYKEPFGKYRIRVEYRFVGDQCPGGPGWATRNSGVMLHCQSPETMAVGQDFPVSIEVQFLGGLGKGKRSTANLCTPGTHVVYKGKLHTPHCTNSQSDTFNGDQWVTVEAEVLGDGTITHFVNGVAVMEYEQPQLDPADKDGKALIEKAGGVKLLTQGYIALQAESHPCDYRKVEVKRLK